MSEARKKKILVLGGTQFVGRNLAEALLKEQDIELTLFNRQQSQPDLFQQAARIKGDRKTSDIEQISQTNWDVVIDVSCYFPADLQLTLSALANQSPQYIFISTCSVYSDTREVVEMKLEDARTHSCSAHQASDPSNASYGSRKAECERILQNSGRDHVIFRPALVYGPHDHTDRFYYWLHQVNTNEQLLLPDQGERRFSITFVHDLVESIMRAFKKPKSNEVYNAISIPQVSIREIVECAGYLMHKEFSTINAPHEFLHDQGVKQWVDMPLWLDANHFTYNNEKLKSQLGISPSALEDGMRTTIEYYENLDWAIPSYGISEEKRLSLIEMLESASI
jgi:2'-hydroxyisoflavone reductase